MADMLSQTEAKPPPPPPPMHSNTGPRRFFRSPSTKSQTQQSLATISPRSPALSPSSTSPRHFIPYHRSLSQTSLDISPHLFAQFVPPPHSSSSPFKRIYPLAPGTADFDPGLRIDVLAAEASRLDGEEEWRKISGKILRIFSQENNSEPVENLTELIRRSLFDRGQQALVEDFFRLLTDGMQFFRAKIPVPLTTFLFDEESQRLFLSKLAETWEYFRSVVAPFLECVFLPLHVDIYYVRDRVDVRSVIMASFRDQLTLPLADRIRDALLQLPFLTDASLTKTLKVMIQLLGILSNNHLGDSDRRRRMLNLWQVAISRWRGVANREGDPRISRTQGRRRTTGASSNQSHQYTYSADQILLPSVKKVTNEIPNKLNSKREKVS